MPSSTLARSTMYPVQAMAPGIEMCMFMMKSENVTWWPYLQSNLGNMSRVLWGSFANNTHTTEARFFSAVLSQSIMSPACVTTNFGWLLLGFSIVLQFSASRSNRRVSIDCALNSRLWQSITISCVLWNKFQPSFLLINSKIGCYRAGLKLQTKSPHNKMREKSDIHAASSLLCIWLS
jgi:hypothetical protein